MWVCSCDAKIMAEGEEMNDGMEEDAGHTNPNEMTSEQSVNHHSDNNTLNMSSEENLIEAILNASLNAPDATNMTDLNSISGEFSSLNNTIDELNTFLDQWDQRHDRLRQQIRQTLEEQKAGGEEETRQDSGSQKAPLPPPCESTEADCKQVQDSLCSDQAQPGDKSSS